MIYLIKKSSTVVIGIFLAGLLLDEVGTNGRLGSTLQELANKITRGFGQ